MARIDWSYHRPAWKTCGRTQEFLANNGIEVKEEINARRVALLEDEVLDLLKKIDCIYATSGKKTVCLDLRKDNPSQDVLLKTICRNGKLRAPALRKGKTLLVGFDKEVYVNVLA